MAIIIHLYGYEIDKDKYTACGTSSPNFTAVENKKYFKEKLNNSIDRHYCCKKCTHLLEKFENINS